MAIAYNMKQEQMLWNMNKYRQSNGSSNIDYNPG